jgi:LAO/AO transport system kinase
MGDDVQSLKAGLMEIADIFVLNKSDREGAGQFEERLRAILQMMPDRDGWRPPVVRTVATENTGVDELARQIALFREHFSGAPSHGKREVDYWKEWLMRLVRSRLLEQVAAAGMTDAKFEALASQVAARKKDPYAAASEILARAESTS